MCSKTALVMVSAALVTVHTNLVLECFAVAVQTDVATLATVDTRHTWKFVLAMLRELLVTLAAVPWLPRTHCTHHCWDPHALATRFRRWCRHRRRRGLAHP